MFNKIKNPNTGKWVKTDGAKGREILNDFINELNNHIGGGIVTSITKNNFKRFIKNDIRLVGYFSDFCDHCNKMKPEWNNFVNNVNYPQFKVGEVDTSLDFFAIQSLAKSQNIDGFPAIQLFKNGKLVNQHIGRLSKDEISQFIKSNE